MKFLLQLPSFKENELLGFIVSMKIFYTFIDRLGVNTKPLFHLFHDIFMFHWIIELQTLFQQLNISITKDITLKLPNKNNNSSLL